MEFKIYVIDGDDYDYRACQEHGCRHDMVLKIGDNFYNLSVYELWSFEYFVELFLNEKKEVLMDFSMLIVKDMLYETIIKTIIANYKNGYFDNMKPCLVQDGKVFLKFDKRTANAYKIGNIETEIEISKLKIIYSDCVENFL
jgi:hypothetical protein